MCRDYYTNEVFGVKDNAISLFDFHNLLTQANKMSYVDAYLHQPAVGYPSLPDQSVNFLLNELLHMEQIGITLTENGAMRPHATVCGLMLAHPAARYFAVGKIGNDQLEDYARRRRMPINEVRKFLAANL